MDEVKFARPEKGRKRKARKKRAEKEKGGKKIEDQEIYVSFPFSRIKFGKIDSALGPELISLPNIVYFYNCSLDFASEIGDFPRKKLDRRARLNL